MDRLMIRDVIRWYRDGKTPVKQLPRVVFRRLHGNLRPYVFKLHNYFPSLVRVSTSVTDRVDYTSICERAATDDSVFSSFKRHPSYVPVLEHVSCEQGQAYLDYIRDQFPNVMKRFDEIKINDTIGLPNVCVYSGIGAISPTTLRYACIAGDLLRRFLNLDGMKIIEIGPAYGGQCVVLSKLVQYGQYIGVDLPSSLKLMRRYIESLGVPHVVLRRQEELSDNDTYDLVVSNYAFSECSKPVQEYYIDKVLSRAKRGYILYNADGDDSSLSKPWVPYNKRRILEILGKFHTITATSEIPETGRKQHTLITWGCVG